MTLYLLFSLVLFLVCFGFGFILVCKSFECLTLECIKMLIFLRIALGQKLCAAYICIITISVE